MRRLAVVVIVALLGSVVCATAAHARGMRERDVTGSFIGNGDFFADCQFTPGDGRNFGAGSGTITPFGSSVVTFRLCRDVDDPATPVRHTVEGGEFTIANRRGTIEGEFNGYVDFSPPGPFGLPFHFDATVLRSAGRYQNASGHLVFDGTFTRGFGDISGTVRGSFSYGGVRPLPSERIHGKAQFPSFEGDQMRIDLDVRCDRPCRAPTGVVRLTRHVGANAEHLTMIPLCVGTSSVGPPHTNLATLAGPAFDRDGVLVGRMTVGMSDFGDGQRPGIPGLPYIDEAWASVTSNGDESPFCPNALRHAGGPEITRGDIKIECDTGGC